MRVKRRLQVAAALLVLSGLLVVCLVLRSSWLLCWSVRNGHEGLAALQLVLGADPTEWHRAFKLSFGHGDPPGRSYTAISEAVDRGDADMVVLVVTLSRHDDVARRALLGAVHRQDTDVVRALVDAGVDVDAPDESGRTPLELAVRKRTPDPELIAALLEKGARFNDGFDPRCDEMAVGPRAKPRYTLHCAAMDGRVDRLRALHEAGEKMDDHFGDGVTPLVRAATAGHVDAVALLLDVGVPVDATTQWGETALSRAAREGRLDVVRLLVQAGADVSLQDAVGRTALDRAKVAGHADVVALLQASDTGG